MTDGPRLSSGVAVRWPGSTWQSRRVAIGVAQQCALGSGSPNRQFNLYQHALPVYAVREAANDACTVPEVRREQRRIDLRGS